MKGISLPKPPKPMFFCSNLFPKGSDPRKPSPNKIHLGPRSNPLASKRRYRAYLKKKNMFHPRKLTAGTWQDTPGRGKSSSKPSMFRCELLVSGRVTCVFFCKKMDPETSRFHEFSSHFWSWIQALKKLRKGGWSQAIWKNMSPSSSSSLCIWNQGLRKLPDMLACLGAKGSKDIGTGRWGSQIGSFSQGWKENKWNHHLDFY